LNTTESPIKPQHFLFVIGTVVLSIAVAVGQYLVLGVLL